VTAGAVRCANCFGVGFPVEPARTETLMGEMEVGVPQDEIARQGDRN